MKVLAGTSSVILRRLLALASLVLLFGSASQAADLKGRVVVPGTRPGEIVVIYLTATPETEATPRLEHAVVDMKGMAFVPHVLVIPTGTTVDFINSDPIAHNVYWPSIGGNKRLARNLGTWEPGARRSYTFNDAGIVPLLCAPHPNMSAYLVVVPTAYYATSNDQGDFEIRDVPPGHYTLKAWSESGKPLAQTVEVPDQQTPISINVGG